MPRKETFEDKVAKLNKLQSKIDKNNVKHTLSPKVQNNCNIVAMQKNTPIFLQAISYGQADFSQRFRLRCVFA